MTSISIIIATYNAENYLQNCISSIIPQLNMNVELLIIDGASKDNTLSIIKKNKEFISQWISEPDLGIYDAWNKGIKRAKGNWIMFLGADDILLPKAIKDYVKYINDNKHNNFDIISSKINYVNNQGKKLKILGEPWNWNKFVKRNLSFAHPGLLHNKDLFKKFGYYNIKYSITADSEFFLRTKGDIKAGFVDTISVQMLKGGISFSDKAILESYKTRKDHKSLSSFLNLFLLIKKIILFRLSLAKQFLIAKL